MRQSTPILNNGQRAGWFVFAAIILMLLLSCRAFLDFGKYFLELNGKSLLERGSEGSSEWQSFLARSTRREQQQTFPKVHQALEQATDGGKTAARVIFTERGIIIVDRKARSPMRTLGSVAIVRSEQDLPRETSANGFQVLVHSEKEFSSDVEQRWAWALQRAAELPPDAKLFVNEGSFSLYLISNFFFYPRRVDVDPHPTQILNDQTFDAALHDSSNLDRTDLTKLEAKLQPLGYTHLITREEGALRILTLRKR